MASLRKPPHLNSSDRANQPPCPSLLRNLEAHARVGRKKLSAVASQNALFLKCDVRRFIINLPVERFGCIIDLTTLIIDRLQPVTRPCTNDEPCSSSYSHGEMGYRNETWIANLLHLLLCLRALAYELLIKMRMKLLMPTIKDWYLEWDQEQVSHQNEWQQQKIANRNQMWFAEWPGRRPPLNTTWPWLVKPSLMVLWGVCWMFYGENAYQSSPIGQDGRTQRAHQLEIRQPRQRGQQGPDLGKSPNKLRNADELYTSICQRVTSLLSSVLKIADEELYTQHKATDMACGVAILPRRRSLISARVTWPRRL